MHDVRCAMSRAWPADFSFEDQCSHGVAPRTSAHSRTRPIQAQVKQPRQSAERAGRPSRRASASGSSCWALGRVGRAKLRGLVGAALSREVERPPRMANGRGIRESAARMRILMVSDRHRAVRHHVAYVIPVQRAKMIGLPSPDVAQQHAHTRTRSAARAAAASARSPSGSAAPGMHCRVQGRGAETSEVSDSDGNTAHTQAT